MKKWIKYIVFSFVIMFTMMGNLKAEECEYVGEGCGKDKNCETVTLDGSCKEYIVLTLEKEDVTDNYLSVCSSVKAYTLKTSKFADYENHYGPGTKLCYVWRLKEKEIQEAEEKEQKAEDALVEIKNYSKKLEDTTKDYCYKLENDLESSDSYFEADAKDADINNSYVCLDPITKMYGVYSESKKEPLLGNGWKCYPLAPGKKCKKLKDKTIANPVYTSGCDALGETLTLIKEGYNILKYLIPVLIIGLSIIDFVKTIIINDEKNYKQTWNKLVKRLIIGIVILILPQILSLLIRLSGVTSDSNNIFCIF